MKVQNTNVKTGHRPDPSAPNQPLITIEGSPFDLAVGEASLDKLGTGRAGKS